MYIVYIIYLLFIYFLKNWNFFEKNNIVYILITQTITKPLNQSINHLFNQSINQSIIHQSIKQNWIKSTLITKNTNYFPLLYLFKRRMVLVLYIWQLTFTTAYLSITNHHHHHYLTIQYVFHCVESWKWLLFWWNYIEGRGCKRLWKPQNHTKQSMKKWKTAIHFAKKSSIKILSTLNNKYDIHADLSNTLWKMYILRIEWCVKTSLPCRCLMWFGERKALWENSKPHKKSATEAMLNQLLVKCSDKLETVSNWNSLILTI